MNKFKVFDLCMEDEINEWIKGKEIISMDITCITTKDGDCPVVAFVYEEVV